MEKPKDIRSVRFTHDNCMEVDFVDVNGVNRSITVVVSAKLVFDVFVNARSKISIFIDGEGF